MKTLGKITTAQRDDYTTGYLLGYTYFKDCYKMIAIDLISNKHQIPILEQFNRLMLLPIQIMQEIQESFSFLKKQKKLS